MNLCDLFLRSWMRDYGIVYSNPNYSDNRGDAGYSRTNWLQQTFNLKGKKDPANVETKEFQIFSRLPGVITNSFYASFDFSVASYQKESIKEWISRMPESFRLKMPEGILHCVGSFVADKLSDDVWDDFWGSLDPYLLRPEIRMKNYRHTDWEQWERDDFLELLQGSFAEKEGLPWDMPPPFSWQNEDSCQTDEKYKSWVSKTYNLCCVNSRDKEVPMEKFVDGTRRLIDIFSNLQSNFCFVTMEAINNWSKTGELKGPFKDRSVDESSSKDHDVWFLMFENDRAHLFVAHFARVHG